MKLDIACGQRCKDGFEGVDLVPGPHVTHVVNLFYAPWRKAPWHQNKAAFEAESVDEIWCSHFVEHTPDLIGFMDECYRVLKVGATMTITAPYYTSIRSWQDPTHTRAITDATVWYFNRGWRERNRLDHYPIKSDFEVVDTMHSLHPRMDGKPREEVIRALTAEWNVAEDIIFVLKKLAVGK